MNQQSPAPFPAAANRGRSTPAAQPFPLRSALVLATLAVGVTGSSMLPRPAVAPAAASLARQVPAVVGPVAATVVAAPVKQAAADAADTVPSYDEHELRTRMRWMQVRVGTQHVATPDPDSRLLLVRVAAQRAALGDVGLDWRDVYGVINAETSWVPRPGIGRNGVVSHGIAQFEPATARALGLRNPNDVVEAVHAAAVHLKEAALWSARRIATLGLSPEQRAERLREGVSVYYNLSSRGRREWSGLNTAQMPIETRRHIYNVQMGARLAQEFATPGIVLGAAPVPPVAEPAVLVARAEPEAPARAVRTRAQQEAPARAVRTRAELARPAAPREVGTITWSGKGGRTSAPGAKSGTYVVWSNGKLTKQGAPSQHGALTFTQRRHVG